ncbi:trigger factor [Parelusimicrobium proximum]|uniref:trigger factor n=1 Tax=Parelusimicrobium proximum TaxID=3228953 RepID=UPI003D16EA86
MSIFAKAEKNELKVKKTNQEDCKITFEVEAEPSLVTKCFDNAAVQVQSRAQMHGFRAGKVPLTLVKQNFPSHIKERAIDGVIKAAVTGALEKENINPVTVPTLTKADLDTLAEGKPFTFEFTAEVAPVVEPKNYTGIKIKKLAETVSDADIDAQIAELLQHNSRLEEDTDDTVKDDSFAAVKYDAEKDGKHDYEFSADEELIDMSTPHTIAGLTEALKGMKKGETKEFDSTFRGETIHFKVTVLSLKKKIAPTLDDAFAKDLGLKDVADLKAKVKENMEREAKSNSERDMVIQIENELVKENNFPLPQGLVEEQLNAAVDNFIARFGGDKAKLTPEQHKELAEKMRANVEKDIKIGYLVHAIAKKEGLEGTEKDWQEELDKSLASNDKKDEKKIREFFNERKTHILATLNEKKVFDFLKEKADIK